MIGGRILFHGALLLCLIGGFAWGADNPTRGRVGGIDTADGEVAIRLPTGGRSSGDSQTGVWSDAGRNDPIASGMAVRTAAAARATLRVGADLIAFADSSEADFVRLDRVGTRIALRRGRLGVRLSEFDARREIEITIPSGTLRLSAPGEYDIVAGDATSPARVAVATGTARFSGGQIDAVITSGGAVLLSGGDSVTMLPGSTDDDAFGEWWRGQQRDPADSLALRHVSAALSGHEALDGHGTWEDVAGIGAVWFPSDLPSGWAPYRYGRWRWIGRWGWTWIDDMKWGFATSHYGRWAHIGDSDADAGTGAGRWGWVPGERVEEPVFMPAAVAFLGTAGVGLSYPDAFSPAVAWFPLAPGEVYWPSFTDDPDAIRRINQGAVADLAAIGAALRGDPPAEIVTGAYRNRRYASVVPRAVFVGGRPVAEAVIDLPVRRLENAPLLAGSPGIKPSEASPPVKAAIESARRGAAPNMVKARDTLAHIVKAREQGARAAAPAVSRKPAAKASAAAQRAGKRPAVKRNEKERIERAMIRARSAAASKAPPHKAERSGKPAKSHAAGLRRSDAAGG